MFSVNYDLKGTFSMSFSIKASTPEEARKIADGWIKVEAAGYKIKKVTVRKTS